MIEPRMFHNTVENPTFVGKPTLLCDGMSRITIMFHNIGSIARQFFAT
jgi:hypothetical protein